MHTKLKMCFSSQGSDKPLLNFCNSVFAWALYAWAISTVVKVLICQVASFCKDASFISRLLTPPLLQLPLYFLRSLLVARDWTSQFLFGLGFLFFFFCSSSVFYFMAWFQGHLRKLPLEYKVVAGYLTCSSLSFGHWLVPWTFFLMTASWLTASSCTCSRASGCFCLELKKSPNHKLSVTFQLRVTPGKLWQIQTQCTSSEIRGKSESIYTRTNA